MKRKLPTNITSYSVYSFFIFLLITTNFFYAAAQSGRIIQKPAAQEEKADEISCPEKQDEYKYVFSASVSEFVKELNVLGKCGYRLEKVTKRPLGYNDTYKDIEVYAIVKLYAGNRYEYDWFEAYTSGEITTRMNYRAEKGFYFRKNILFIEGRCGTRMDKQIESDGPKDGAADVNEYRRELFLTSKGAIFFVERKNGIVKKNEYKDLISETRWGSVKEMQESLNNAVAKGFRPVGINYLGTDTTYSVLLEKDADIKSEDEYRVIREIYGFNKKINSLAKEGFKPFIVGYAFAVLAKNKSEISTAKFDSAKFSEVEKQTKLINKGAVYHINGWQAGYCDSAQEVLFFELPLAEDKKRFEYKTLTMTNFEEQNANKQTKSVQPTEKSKEAFSRMLNDGYKIRDIFGLYEVHILFEREQK